jgi:multiple sugar transport system permease protein
MSHTLTNTQAIAFAESKINLVAKKRKQIAMLFLLPLTSVMLLLVIWPLVFNIYLSFRNHNLFNVTSHGWAGIDNFIFLFKSDVFWESLQKLIIYVFFVVGIEFILGFAIAFLLDREMKGISLLRGIVVLPLIMAPVVVGFFWRFLFEPSSGLLNFLLSIFGFSPRHWIDSADSAMVAIMLVDIWQWTPFMILVLLAGIQAVPKEVLEAAMLDGLSFVKRLRYVVIPILKPIILIVILIRIVDSIKVFDTILVLTRGGPGTSTYLMSVYNYDLLFQKMEAGDASALALITVILINIFAMALIKILRVNK